MRIPAGTVVCFNYPAFHSAGFARPASFEPDRWLSLRPAECAYIPFGVRANRPCPAQRLSLVVVPALARALARALELRAWCAHSRSLPGRGLCVVEWREGAGPASSRAPDSAPALTGRATADSVFSAATGDGLRVRGGGGGGGRDSGAATMPATAPMPALAPAPAPVARQRRLAERPALLWALRLGLIARELAEDVVISLCQLVLGTALVLAARRAQPAFNYHARNICPRGGEVPAALR